MEETPKTAPNLDTSAISVRSLLPIEIALKAVEILLNHQHMPSFPGEGMIFFLSKLPLFFHVKTRILSLSNAQ